MTGLRTLELSIGKEIDLHEHIKNPTHTFLRPQTVKFPNCRPDIAVNAYSFMHRHRPHTLAQHTADADADAQPADNLR